MKREDTCTDDSLGILMILWEEWAVVDGMYRNFTVTLDKVERKNSAKEADRVQASNWALVTSFRTIVSHVMEGNDAAATLRKEATTGSSTRAMGAPVLKNELMRVSIVHCGCSLWMNL